MTDIPGSELSAWEIADHTLPTLIERSAHCPPPPAERALSYPSWKVIVSASRGQKLNRPGSLARPFFMTFFMVFFTPPFMALTMQPLQIILVP